MNESKTIQPNSFVSVTISSRFLHIARTTNDLDIEFAIQGADSIELNRGDTVDCEQATQAIFRNANAEPVTIEYGFTSNRVYKNTQALSKVSSIENPVDIGSMPAVQVEATVAAAATAGDSVTININAGQTVLVLAANPNRHKAIIGRGETDLYNIKLGYNNAASAQNGLIFGADAIAEIDVKAAVYAHNHSAETQTVIVTDTEIETGA